MKDKTIRNAVIPRLKSSDLSEKLLSYFQQSQPQHLQLPIYNSSYVHLLLARAFIDLKKTILLVFNDKQDALYALNEVENWLGKKHSLYFPSTYLNPYQIEETQNANVVLRT